MKNITKTYVGVDVSKKHLDICLYPGNKTIRIENTKRGISKLSLQLKELNIAKILLEASGGYERLAIVMLSERYNVFLVNPKRIYDFRNARGTKAKTDPIDANLIAEFAANSCSRNIAIVNTKNMHLKDLFTRKQELKKMTASEKNRLEKKLNTVIKREICGHIKFLERRINKLDMEINKIIESNNDLKKRSCILKSMPGVGNETAQGIISILPEAGKIDNREIASLAGLAPQTNESGQFIGKARIKNGRNATRKILYMAAVSAIRCNPKLKSFYKRLKEKGKPSKVVLVAVMRKMLIILNTMLKKDEIWRPELG